MPEHRLQRTRETYRGRDVCPRCGQPGDLLALGIGASYCPDDYHTIAAIVRARLEGACQCEACLAKRHETPWAV